MRREIARVELVKDGRSARSLLTDDPTPGIVRAVVCRADEVRFGEPQAGLEVATAALEAVARLADRDRRPSLQAYAWSVYGSACRGVERYEDAEFALARAAELIPRRDKRGRALIARRLATVYADQRRRNAAQKLYDGVLWLSRQIGGQVLAEDLVQCSAILIRFNEFQLAADHLEEALPLLQRSGDRFHISAVFNLARCRLELASSKPELETAAKLLAKARPHVEPGTFSATRIDWLDARLLHRAERLDESLVAFESVRADIEERAEVFDCSLLMLDIAELRLDRGEPEQAHRVALSSFRQLQLLRDYPDAYRALIVLHTAAAAADLDRATIRLARSALLAASRS